MNTNIFRHLSICLTLVATLSGCVASSSNNYIAADLSTRDGGAAKKLPSVTVADLEGNDYSLPADFRGDYNIVLFGFAHKQQESIDTWLPHLIPLAGRTDRVQLMEIPVIDNSNMTLRTIIRNGMRSGITDSAARQRTRTLFVDKTAFERELGVTDDSRILLAVFDRDGVLIWRASGDFTESQFEDLRSLLGVAEKAQ